MNILSIGNSFSQDATRYLYEMAKKQGYKNFHTTNLVIGGCSLYKHFVNMHSGEKAYALAINGHGSGYNMSIKEALLSRQWDYITLQQVSGYSYIYDSFEPYLTELIAYIRNLAPKAKIYLHETWAYEKDSARLKNEGFNTPEEMYEKIHEAYIEASKKADGIIPSGRLFINLLHSGVDNLHLDTMHASFGIGRYALALLWLRTFTGANITENSFDDFDEPITEKEITIAKKCIMEL